MFGKQAKESNKEFNPPEIEDFMLSNEESSDLESKKVGETLSPNSDIKQPEFIGVVEKISGIVSPYFIVIVGLYLYENNFFLGTILIAIGIIYLLKISVKDMMGWWEKIKSLLGLDNE